jgi:phage gp36-like protein
MATPALTTVAMIEARLSAVGTALRVDHAPGAALLAAITQASADVQLYLNGRYSDDELLTSDWAKGVATDRAILHLSRWRNNTPPKFLLEMWDEAVKLLTDIAMGKLNLPGVELGDSRVPQMSVVTANFGQYPSVRRINASSTRTPSRYTPRTDPFEPPAQ